MCKKSRFRGDFEKQNGKRTQGLLESPSHYFYHIYWALATKLFSEKSLSLIAQILGLLVNTSAAHEKYLVLQRDNLTIPVHMHLTQKLKTFRQLLAGFFKSILILLAHWLPMKCILFLIEAI